MSRAGVVWAWVLGFLGGYILTGLIFVALGDRVPDTLAVQFAVGIAGGLLFGGLSRRRYLDRHRPPS